VVERDKMTNWEETGDRQKTMKNSVGNASFEIVLASNVLRLY